MRARIAIRHVVTRAPIASSDPLFAAMTTADQPSQNGSATPVLISFSTTLLRT